jgi:hypothetical protein
LFQAQRAFAGWLYNKKQTEQAEVKKMKKSIPDNSISVTPKLLLLLPLSRSHFRVASLNLKSRWFPNFLPQKITLHDNKIAALPNFRAIVALHSLVKSKTILCKIICRFS